MYANHPTLVIITGSFLQIARSSSRYSAHPDRGIRRTCVRVASRTRATHLSLTRTYALTYTTIHLPIQRHAAILCRHTLGSPGRPYVEEATLFFSSSSFLGPADPPSRSVSGNTLSSAPRRARTSKSRRLFEKGTSESRGFPARGSGDRSPSFPEEVTRERVKCEYCAIEICTGL